ncbi:MAG: hypothetical protein HXY20_10045 [Acidobacteria bacterium]|nr:hypothetical protein [Acidobacteriota bacterium]
MALHWGSLEGSNPLDDFHPRFEVPFRDLLAEEHVHLKVPYQGSGVDKNGAWTVKFTP